MTTTLHRKIKQFAIEGQFLDDRIASDIKEINERVLDIQMRDMGYIRALDIDPAWTTEYNPMQDEWRFKMSIYGFYVGKRKSWQYEGSFQGKLIPRATPKAISKQ
jgi:hypothetical protein